MKNYLFVRFLFLGASAIFFSGLNAQSSTERSFSAEKNADKIALAGLKAVNAKMFNHFSRNYKNATDIRIRPVGENTHVVFKADGVQNGVQYNKKGKWLHSIRYFDESKLPADVRSMVHSGYPGFTIFGSVTELKVLDKTALLVLIENMKEWKRIRIVNDEMDIYEEYVKP